MFGWLLTTAGTAALGSVFPLVNIELYLLATASTVGEVSWWALGLAAAVGQVAGKTLFHLAGRGSFALSGRLRSRLDRGRTGRWAAWLDRFHERTQQHPWWGLGVLCVSSVPGIPPYSVMSFLSGAAGLPLSGFLAASLIGRSGHFLIVASASGLVQHLPGVH